MGRPKQLLPWGQEHVISHVVRTLAAAGAEPVYVVVGHAADQISACLQQFAPDIAYHIVHNDAYATGEMLSSFQSGIGAAIGNAKATGTLLALTDQPQIPAAIIRQVLVASTANPDAICIPSYQRRRGHPFYLPRRLWPELLELKAPDTLRDLLKAHEKSIIYVDVDSPSILRDMDTPEDYADLTQSN